MRWGQKKNVKSVLCALVLVDLVRSVSQVSHAQDMRSSGFMTIGSNKIDCKAGDKVRPFKVFRIHIPETIYADISSHIVNCGSAASCVSSTDPSTVSDEDDDGKPGDIEFTRKFPSSNADWSTPLDIDLSPASSQIWQNAKNAPLMIKIILDDPDDSFIHPQTPHLPPPPPPAPDPYWSHAVLQGDVGNGMFRCLSAPRQETIGTITRWFITVLVYKAGVKNNDNSAYGGLSIGILRRINSLPPGLYLPVYVDPQIHNNG